MPSVPLATADRSGPRPQALPRWVWWVVWLVALGFAGLLYVFLGDFGGEPGEAPESIEATELIPMMPLALSIVMRWLVLPFCRHAGVLFLLFLVGLSLGEAAALTALFLGEYFGQHLFFAGVLAIFQFIPLFSIEPARA